MAAKRKSKTLGVAAADVRSHPSSLSQLNGAEGTRPLKAGGEEALLQGMKKLARQKLERHNDTAIPSRLGDQLAVHQVNESHATIAVPKGTSHPVQLNGVKVPIHILDDEDDSSREKEHASRLPTGAASGTEAPRLNGQRPMSDEEDRDHEDVADAEPSFGELVAAHSADVVDVEAAFGAAPEQAESSLALQPRQGLPIPSANSLGTVLNQALKTNDVELLESCLQVPDISAIRGTIMRMQSSLATTLLSKLAERMHRRPSRAGSLMNWIQWTLISHGGYLAGQPDLMSQLEALHDVLHERARGLQPLLSLKGKLDMLEAQMQLRRSMQNPRHAAESEDDENDERVIYVEGQHDTAESDGEDDGNPDIEMVDAISEGDGEDEASDVTDSDAEMPTTVNGVESESEGPSDDDESLIDDEAEETDADTGDDIEDDDDDDETDFAEGESIGDDEDDADGDEAVEGNRPSKRRR